VSVARKPRIEESVDLREHVESLCAHYRLSGDVADALGTLAAMVVDPDESVLPRRPATNRLIAIRLSSCAAPRNSSAFGGSRRIGESVGRR
jgi:hypothetical protein